MRNILPRLQSALVERWRTNNTPPRMRSGLWIAFVLFLFVGIISVLGSNEDTRAASRSARNDRPQDEGNISDDFQFIGQGRIIGGSGVMWIIGDVPILVDDHTQLINGISVGDFVTLSGRILPDNVWSADRIELTQGERPFFTFNGPLERVGELFWQIGGNKVFVNPQTEADSSLKINDMVLVTFTVLGDGSWLASDIRAFDPTLFELFPTPAPTSTSKEPAKEVVPSTAPNPDSNERDEEREDKEDKDEDEQEQDYDDDENEEDKDEHKEDKDEHKKDKGHDEDKDG